MNKDTSVYTEEEICTNASRMKSAKSKVLIIRPPVFGLKVQIQILFIHIRANTCWREKSSGFDIRRRRRRLKHSTNSGVAFAAVF